MLYLKWLESKARPKVLRSILRFKRFDVRNSIILVSEPRSGSTWLMEVLARHPRTIINWEPLHPQFGALPSVYQDGVRLDMQRLSSNDEFRRKMEDVLTYRNYTTWMTSHLDWARVISANTVLVKMVRAVRMLPWLVEEFDFIHKPIHLLRHPIPTVLSQTVHFKEMLAIDIVKRIGNCNLSLETLDFLKHLQGQHENRLALWCIFNQEVLSQSTEKWITVYYEDLIRDPVNEIERINIECVLSVPTTSIDFNKPSKSDFRNQFVRENKEKQLSKWINQVIAGDRERMQRVLDYFDIRVYSAYDIYPLK